MLKRLREAFNDQPATPQEPKRERKPKKDASHWNADYPEKT